MTAARRSLFFYSPYPYPVSFTSLHIRLIKCRPCGAMPNTSATLSIRSVAVQYPLCCLSEAEGKINK